MEKKQFCDVCKKDIDVSSQSNWSKHVKSKKHTTNASPSPPAPRFSCSFPGCNYITNRKFNYERHAGAREGKEEKVVYRFKCTVCDMPLRDASHRKWHVPSTMKPAIRELAKVITKHKLENELDFSGYYKEFLADSLPPYEMLHFLRQMYEILSDFMGDASSPFANESDSE